MVKQRFKAIPAVYLLLVHEGSILLTKRYNTGYMDGHYMVPSGHVEAGESFKQAMIREAKEEVGITLNPNDLNFVHLLYRSKHDETGERADIFFVATTWLGQPYNAEEDKCDEVSWYSLDKLPNKTVPYLLQVIAALALGEMFSELGWD